MNWMLLTRIGKGVALFAFLLPWLVVSCQETPIASATGLNLATGSIKSMGAGMAGAGSDASPQMWVVLALVLIAAGMAATFMWTPAKRAAAAAGGTAAAAFLLLAVGMMMTIANAKSKIAEQQGGGDEFAMGMQQAVAQAIQFDVKIGYWLALAGLAGAAISAFMLFTGRAVPPAAIRLGDTVRKAAADLKDGVASGGAASEDDARYWDRMTDKNDPSALEEYIYRFPEGRFATLARERLARAGMAAKPSSSDDGAA